MPSTTALAAPSASPSTAPLTTDVPSTTPTALAAPSVSPTTASLYSVPTASPLAKTSVPSTTPTAAAAPSASPTTSPIDAIIPERRLLEGCSPPSCDAALRKLTRTTLVVAAVILGALTVVHLICFAIAGAAVVVEPGEEGAAKGPPESWHATARRGVADLLLWPRLPWPWVSFVVVAIALQAAQALPSPCWGGKREAVVAVLVAGAAVAIYVGVHGAYAARGVRRVAKFEKASSGTSSSTSRVASPLALVAALKPAFLDGEELFDSLALGEWVDKGDRAYVGPFGALFEDFDPGFAAAAESALLVLPEIAAAVALGALGCGRAVAEALVVAAIAVVAAGAVLYLRPFANAGENAVAIVVAIGGVGVLVAVAAAAVLDSDTVLDEAAKAAVIIELGVLGLTVLLPLAAGVARLLRAALRLFRATGRDSESNVEALQVLGDEAPGACASLLATASRLCQPGFASVAARLFRDEACRLCFG